MRKTTLMIFVLLILLSSGCQKAVETSVLNAVAESGGGKVLHYQYTTTRNVLGDEILTRKFVVCYEEPIYVTTITNSAASNKTESRTSDPLEGASCKVSEQ